MAAMLLEQQRQLAAARQRFAEGDDASAGLLKPALQRSWERSRRAGVRPQDVPESPPPALRSAQLEDAADRHLARCVRQDMDDLWAAFGGRDWTLFCVNAAGLIIAQREHGLGDARVLQSIQVGRRVRETDIGTTAPACSLAEDAAAVVHGNEHYLEQFSSVYCLSVPLHGLDGEVVGALDITGIGERDSELLGGYFRQAALSIENRLIQQYRPCHLLALQHDARWLHTPLQGLLAIEPDGCVRAANSVARRLLGLPRRGRLPRVSTEEVFAGASVHQRRRLLKAGPAYRVQLGADSAVQVQYLRGPLAAHASTRLGRTAPTMATDSLRTQGVRAVREAVAVHQGNLSAAARQLGISRTTLYRKLQQGG